jgi:nicotinate-nucleotide--dimethylbenzimidazole phosphoribosyltransferase
MTFIIGRVVAELTREITPPDESWRTRARTQLDTLTKPLGSLGRLEDLAAQIVSIRREPLQAPVRKAVYIFAADHGVTAEGVSAYPSAVTHQMVLNFLAGGAAINVLARLHGVDLHVVDMGVDAEFNAVPGLLHHKVARGTANMLHEPAMNDEQLAQALLAGAALGGEAAGAGVILLAIGEMGIGNTTSASAITCALTGAHPALATGRGTGLDSQARGRKVAVVDAILKKHFASQAAPSAIDIIRCMGGLEIAGMVGMVLAAARHRIAVVADGFISTAAVALAVALEPRVQGYVIAGHRSEEPGHAILLEFLQLKPVLTLEMRLGEASGAVLAMPVVESAMALYTEMATFASAGVSEAKE